MGDEGDSELSLDAVFTEPPRPPTPEHTFSTHSRTLRERGTLSGPLDVKIRLVGSHPLWGHYLWNAARSFASYLDQNPAFVRNRFVLELGAGGGLPGIVSVLNGAEKVILTDYPDGALIENLDFNIVQNVPPPQRYRIETCGYIWGHPVDGLLHVLPSGVAEPWRKFDLIIMSDLVFNHSQHDALLTACEHCLTSVPEASSSPPTFIPPPSILVFYTHHRPHLAHRDLEFFAKASKRGWKCEEILCEKFQPMFPEDPGEEEVRSTVYGWLLTRTGD